MALSLHFSGAERRQRIGYWLAHVAGAAVGGALAGGAIGALGLLFGLPSWRAWVVGISVATALVLAIRRGSRSLGRRQVPRRLERRLSRINTFVVWGALLGAGVLTAIPYPAFVVLAGGQLAGGVVLAAISGAVYGLARETLALVPVIRDLGPQRIIALLPALRSHAARLNFAVLCLGGAALTAASWT